MPILAEIPGVGIWEYPDGTSQEDIDNDVYNVVLPNADLANPDPDQVRERPDLFPDIDRGSFLGGLSSGAERLGRAPEAVGAGVFRSQEELDSLKSQMAEEDYNQRYRASLDDVTSQWDKGNYLDAAGTLFTDVLPQTFGESLPDMAVIAPAAVAGAKLGAGIGAVTTGPFAPIGAATGAFLGGVAGTVVAGLPTFFGMNVERQVKENNITDPNEIETLKAASAAALQGGLEGLILPALNLLPGVKGLVGRQVSDLVTDGVRTLTRRDLAGRVAGHAVVGGATEAVTEVGQQALERAQAGLDVSPMQKEVLKEYIEAAVLGGLLGVGFGSAAGAYNAKTVNPKLEKQWAEYDQRKMEQEAELRDKYLNAMSGSVDSETGVAPLLLSPPSAFREGPDLPPGEAAQAVAEATKRKGVIDGNLEEETWRASRNQTALNNARNRDNKTPEQMRAEELGNLARETATPITLTLEEINNVAPEVAKRLSQKPGDITAEQNDYTFNEISDTFKGNAPIDGKLKEEIELLHVEMAPETAADPEAEISDVETLARERRINTGNTSFNAFVKHVSGANNLEEAMPYERKRIKAALMSMPEKSSADLFYDPIPVRDLSYSHKAYTTALDTVRGHAEKIFTTDNVRNAINAADPSNPISDTALNDLRNDMVDEGFLRIDRDEGKNVYRASQMRKTSPPKREKVNGKFQDIPAPRREKAKWVDVLAKDFKNDIAPPAEPATINTGRDTFSTRSEPGRAWNKEAGVFEETVDHIVVSSDPEYDGTQGEATQRAQPSRVVSRHATAQDAEEAARTYGAAAQTTTKKNQAGEDITLPTTDVDLRSMDLENPTVIAYRAQQVDVARANFKDSPRVKKIMDALGSQKVMDYLRKNNVSTSVVEAISNPKGDVGEGVYSSRRKSLNLSLDGAIRAVGENASEEAVIEQLSRIMNHELIHALYDLGVITKDDFQMMARYTRKRARPLDLQKNNRPRNGMTYFEEAETLYQEYAEEAAGDLTGAERNTFIKEYIEEEAIAEAFRDWAVDRKFVTGRPASIFKRITKFFRTMGGLLRENGITETEQMFDLIQSGEKVGGAGLPSSAVKYSVAEGKPKAITAPAIKYKGRTIVGKPGQEHHQVWREYALSERGDRKISPEERMAVATGVNDGDYEQGFMLSREWGGGFVGREEAMGIAFEADQLNPFFEKSIRARRANETGEELITPFVRYSIAPPAGSPELAAAMQGSVVVNTDGSPRTMYHGTTEQFDEFEDAEGVNRSPTKIRAHYFTPNENTARGDTYSGGEGRVIKAHLNMQNPFRVVFAEEGSVEPQLLELLQPELEKRGPNQAWAQSKMINAAESPLSFFSTMGYVGIPGDVQRRILMDAGYDGFIDGTEHAVFSPNQVLQVQDGDKLSLISNEENIKREFGLEMLNLEDMGDGWVSLDDIVVPENARGKGTGSAAMRKITELADASGTNLHLVLGGSATNDTTHMDRLRDWYENFGFEYSSEETMTRATQGDPKFSLVSNNKTIKEIDEEFTQVWEFDVRRPGKATITRSLMASSEQEAREMAKSSPYANRGAYASDNDPNVPGDENTRGVKGSILGVSEMDNFRAVGPKTRLPKAPKYSVSPNNSALLNFIKANPDGFTVSIDSNLHVPPAGFAFAPIKGTEIKVHPDDLGEDHLLQLIAYIDRVQALTDVDVYAGGWLHPDDGLFWLDASMVFDELEQTLYNADGGQQEAIFDLGEFNEINTAQGIEQLRQNGTYSAEAHDVGRRKAAKLKAGFSGAGGQSEAQSAASTQLGERTDGRRVNEGTSLQEDQRYSIVKASDLTGDGRGTTGFFANVAKGTSHQPTTGKIYSPVVALTDDHGFGRAYNQRLGNFDLHIATSIPGFRETQAAVGEAITLTFRGQADMLDIGATEGVLGKTISEQTNGRINTVNLDPNPAMPEIFYKEGRIPGADYVTAAYGAAEDAGMEAWTEDDGTRIDFYSPDREFDVVHEAMVFQFISDGREHQIRRMKELAKDDGLVIIEEKVYEHEAAARSEQKKHWTRVENKKDTYKHQYFAKEDTAKKAEEVLVGMHNNMISQAHTENILTNNFKEVAQFWDSGNFKGYVASDDTAVLQKFLSNLQSLESDFSEVKTPRAVVSVKQSISQDFEGGDVVDDSPKFSIRRYSNLLDQYEYQMATSFSPQMIDGTWGRGAAYIDDEFYPVALFYGTHNDKTGDGFGSKHILAKAERFNGRQPMIVKMNEMLRAMSKRSPNVRYERYTEPKGYSALDYRASWKDPADGKVYVLGLEKHQKDNIQFAAVTTFFPKGEEVASENDLMQYRSATPSDRFSIAKGQALLRSNPQSLGLSPEMAARVSPIYQPEILPSERMPSNKEAARWLEQRYGGGTPVTDFTEELTPEQIGEIATIMAAEVQLGLENTGNAFDWYSGALERALDVVQVKYPMLADDAVAADTGFGTASNARFAFTYIMAVTSQNLDVSANAKATDKAFSSMVKRVKNGEYGMPGSWGTGDKQKAMAKNFDKFGPMIQAMSGTTFPERLTALDALFRESRTVKDWATSMKRQGIPYTKPGQTAVDAVVYGSSLLGPKIGNGFWQNLNGNFSPLTIDLWMRRTWGRLTGKSIGNPDALPAQQQRFKTAIIRSRSRAQGNQDHIEAARDNVRRLEWYLGQVEALPSSELITKKSASEEIKRLKAEINAAKEIAADLQGIKAPAPWKPEYDRDQDAMLAYAKRALSVWNKEYARLREASNSKEVPSELQPTWARAAKTIITNLAKPLDQVANGTQRKQIEAAGQMALDILRSRGIDMTTADMQAVMWYPEKELWGALTTELNTDEDGVPLVEANSLNESYDTAFTRILEGQGNEVQGTTGDRSGEVGSGTVAGSDVQPQRSQGVEGSGGVSTGDIGPEGGRLSIAPSRAEQEIISRLRSKEKNLLNKAKKMWRKWMTSPGLLEDDVFNSLIRRNGHLNSHHAATEFAVKTLERAFVTSYNKNYNELTPKQTADVMEKLSGDDTITLPPSLDEAVAMMRMMIDQNSVKYKQLMDVEIERLKASAAANPQSEAASAAVAKAEFTQSVIVDNAGKYVTRSYRIFDDPNWRNTMSDEVYSNALQYVARQNNGNLKRAGELLSEMLVNGTAADSLEAYIHQSKLGARDLNILKARKEIPKEIREFLGEYKDPRINFSRTMDKMAALITNTVFLNEVFESGTGVFLFPDGQPRPIEANKKIAGETSQAMAPLNGMWVTEEVYQAFIDAVGPNNSPAWYNTIVGVNGKIKSGKTVYSPTTQARNFLSAALFTTATATFNWRHIGRAAKTMDAFIRSKDGGVREYYTDLVRDNLLGDSINAGQIMDMLKDADAFFNEDIQEAQAGTVGNFKRRAKTFTGYAQKLYRAGDDFWKIIAFETESENLRKYKPQWSDQKVREEAILRVRNMIPTYSLTGRAIKALSKFPLVGTFVSFPAEIIRTDVNIMRQISSDFKDPDLRPLAIKRAAGFAITHSLGVAAAATSAALVGVDEDEEEAVRLLGSPWSRNSQLLYLGRDEDGKLRTVDMSFIDPYMMLHKPLVALMRDQPWEDKMTQAAEEVLSPFFGLDIMTGALYEAVSNKKLRGGAVYNQEAPALEQMVDLTGHLFSKLAPGFVAPIQKVYKATRDQRDKTGREYDVSDELLAFVGVKIATFNPATALNYRAYEYKDQIANASRYLGNVASDLNEVSEDELSSAFMTSQDIRKRAYDEMRIIVNAARKSGVSDSAIRKVLRSSGVSVREANALSRNREAPKWRVGKSFLKGNIKRAKLLVDRETAQALRDRRRMVRQQSRLVQ